MYSPEIKCNKIITHVLDLLMIRAQCLVFTLQNYTWKITHVSSIQYVHVYKSCFLSFIVVLWLMMKDEMILINKVNGFSQGRITLFNVRWWWKMIWTQRDYTHYNMIIAMLWKEVNDESTQKILSDLRQKMENVLRFFLVK